MKGLIPCGCGQCMPCRINRRRLWAHRLMLEKDSHTHASFVTLTYRPEEIRDVSGADWSASRPVVGNLVLKDVQDWLKRFRRAVEPNKIRFFAVGEYGEVSQRPHYHVALYGFPSCIVGRTVRDQRGKATCCLPCKTIEKTWGLGRIDVGELNKDSASYIAGYVTKKWTKEDQWTKEKLMGRRTEFVRMSLGTSKDKMGGIGATAIRKLIATGVATRQGKYLKMCLDAPVVLKRSGSPFPLGRYLRRIWREALGRSKDTPEHARKELVKNLHKLYEEDKVKALSEGVPRLFIDPKTVYIRNNRQKILSVEGRYKIFNKGGVL